MAAAAAPTPAARYPEGVRRSAPKDLPWGVRRRIARTIGEAFADDPYHGEFGVPAPLRAKMFRALARITIGRHNSHPCIYWADGGEAVVVATRACDEAAPRRFDVWTSGFGFLVRRLPPATRARIFAWFGKIKKAKGLLEAASGRDLSDAGRVIFVATSNRARGRGLARRLMAAVLADADAAGAPLYLEASATGVDRLYASLGFEALAALHVGGGGGGCGGSGGGSGEAAAAAAGAAADGGGKSGSGGKSGEGQGKGLVIPVMLRLPRAAASAGGGGKVDQK